MTEAELLRRHPVLFHMAEHGAWPSIRDHGLLSTATLLARYGADPAIAGRHRPTGLTLTAPGLPGARIRDQTPLSDAALSRCLRGGLTPADWYRLLNGRVFFWLSEARLGKLLAARLNRGRAHDVLELAAAPLVAAYRDAISLSPINSGSTIRRAAPRGPDTFRPIDAYDDPRPAVELAVDGGVPDVARFVLRVSRRCGAEILTADGRSSPRGSDGWST